MISSTSKFKRCDTMLISILVWIEGVFFLKLSLPNNFETLFVIICQHFSSLALLGINIFS